MGDIFDDVMDDEDEDVDDEEVEQDQVSEVEDPEIESALQSEERCFEPAGAGDPGLCDDTTIDVEIAKLQSLCSTATNASLSVLVVMGFSKQIAYPTLKEEGFSVQKLISC